MTDELFRKMKIAPGARLPPGGRLGRRGNKNQVDSRIIDKIWRPDIYFDYEKHTTRNKGWQMFYKCLTMSLDVEKCPTFDEPCQRHNSSWESTFRYFTLG